MYKYARPMFGIRVPPTVKHFLLTLCNPDYVNISLFLLSTYNRDKCATSVQVDGQCVMNIVVCVQYENINYTIYLFELR